MPDKIIRQIDIGGVDGLHEIAAKYLQAGTVNKTWEDIENLVDGGFEIIVLSTLPEASESAWNTYHNNLVLIADEAATGTYIEWVITRTGSSPNYSYDWEQIGSTDVDLSNYVQKGTYTSEVQGSTVYTDYAPTATYTTSSVAGYTATGEAIVNLPSITLDEGDIIYDDSVLTKNAGAVTIQGSNFTFNGTTMTINNVKPYDIDIDLGSYQFTPSGTIGGSQTVAAHSHTVTLGQGTINYVTGATLDTAGAHSHPVNLTTDNATIQNLTKAASAGDHTHTVNATTAAITYLSGGSVASDGAHTHGVTKTEGTITYATGGSVGSDGAHTHSVSLTTATKTLSLAKSATNEATITISIGAQDLADIVSDGAPKADVVANIDTTGSTITYVNAPASLSSSSNWGFATANTSVMKTATVNNNILSWEAVVAGSQSTITYTPATTATVYVVGKVTGSPVSVIQYPGTNTSYQLYKGEHTHSIDQSEETLTYVTDVTVNSAGTHGHAFYTTTATATFLTDVAVDSAGAHTHVFNGTNATATVMTGATLSAAGAHTHALDGSVSTITYVTGATLDEAGGHSHAVNAATASASFVNSVAVNNGGAHTIQGSNFSFNGDEITHSPTVNSVAIDFTPFTLQPSGTIGGSQDIAAHSHNYQLPMGFTITGRTLTGSAAVAIAAHDHNVTVPQHRHIVGNHTHDVNLN